MKSKLSEQYQQQEQMYLTGISKIRNRYPHNDDYFNKTVTVDDDDDAVNNEDEVDSTKDLERLNNDLFPEAPPIDSDKDKEFEALKALSKQIGIADNYWDQNSEYVLDSHVLLDLLNKNDDIHLKNKEENANILERLEWQSLLQTVLTGDVVTGEKTKLIKPITDVEEGSYLRASYKEDLWLGIRAKLFGRTEEDQKRLVLYHRGLVDETVEEILKFKLDVPEDVRSLTYAEQVQFASKKVNALLEKYDRCQELWNTAKEMENDKPQIVTPEFTSRLNALVAWTSIAGAIDRESYILKVWVGNDDLDILRAASPNISRGNSLSSKPDFDQTARDEDMRRTKSLKGHILKDDRSFVERILKEKDIHDLFERRLFTSFSHWTFKAKTSFLEFQQIFEELGLPTYLDNLFVLAKFPSKLMKELMKTRLSYSQKLTNPTMMMIDQVLDDFKLYISLALEIRTSFLEYCAPQDGWVSLPDYQDTEFDNAILECVHHYLLLLNRKLLDSPKSSKSFRTFKEPEELEREWSFLQNMD
ncbi:unnamed protein product [Ambrosiozyma monospora]|uniref:Unnamed protein product n=1 Tax=Ambrosiozyma monospora TaxID=43982 RepID=A0A9W6Z5S5_AMBMO|nr:unnamed protein product [Ambrosiozyma monospora]